MARYKWSYVWAGGFFMFFAFQGLLVIRYASQLEDSLFSSGPVSAVSLLSRANVSTEILSYRREVQRLNSQSFIRNAQVFGNFSADFAAPVFIIQAHNRVTYLDALIVSLKAVRGIKDALLIFSHDIFSKELNEVVRNITFARVLQIYYPYSSQLYPNGYPGPDPNGTVLPPGYGRTADLTQIKLHWIWKLTQIFRDLDELKNHTGPKIFLEEDHYVLPDVLDVLDQTQAMKTKSCPTCLIILGGYPKEKLWPDMEWRAVRLSRFFASGNNMGMVLDRNFWDNFVGCGREFCTIDDYNWDWTLQHMNQNCFKHPLQILKPDAPRVWHVGDCGTHTKQKWKCKKARIQESIRKIETLVTDNKDQLFQKLKMFSVLKQYFGRTPDPFGGWGDPRDHNMCLAFLRNG